MTSHTRCGGDGISTAGQNCHNVLGSKPCVRQSRLYRERESGNAMKEAMGFGTKWDTDRLEGAYAGMNAYDANSPGRQGESRGYTGAHNTAAHHGRSAAANPQQHQAPPQAHFRAQLPGGHGAPHQHYDDQPSFDDESAYHVVDHHSSANTRGGAVNRQAAHGTAHGALHNAGGAGGHFARQQPAQAGRHSAASAAPSENVPGQGLPGVPSRRGRGVANRQSYNILTGEPY